MVGRVMCREREREGGGERAGGGMRNVTSVVAGGFMHDRVCYQLVATTTFTLSNNDKKPPATAENNKTVEYNKRAAPRPVFSRELSDRWG